MPELLFDLKVQLDQASAKSVKSQLNSLQKEVNESVQGGTDAKAKATKATKAQADAERELYNEFKRQVTVNEVKFRQGQLSQAQALENAEAIERQAIEQGVLSDETLKGARAQKTMFLSQQRINTGFTGMAQESKRANQALLNLGRIVQDLPFGFLGISNNIDPALTSMRQLKEESGGTGAAMRALLGSLKGPGGLIFALGSLLPTAVLIAQRGMNFYAKQTKEADDALQSLNETTKSFIDESARARFDEGGFLGIFEIEAKIESTKRLISLFSDEVENLERQTEAAERRSAAFGLAMGANVKNVNDAETALSAIKEEFQLTDEDIEAITESLEEFNTQLKRIRAQRAADPFLRHKDAVNQAVEAQIELVESGLANEQSLARLRDAYKGQAGALKDLALESDSAKEQYLFLLDTVNKLNSAYESNTIDAAEVIEITREVTEETKKENNELERKIRFMKLIRNMPKPEPFEGPDETRALAAREFARSLESDLQFQAELSGAEGLARKKLEIEREFQQKRLDIIRRFGSETDQVQRILDLMDEERKREHEKAKTEIERKEIEERNRLKQQAWQQSVNIASNFISSLQQLNQSQTDETEQQARQRFETQKKLSKAQAVVAGAAAAVETWKNMGGFPLAIPFVAAQVAATAIQLRAIENTEFNSASSPSSGSTPTATQGFQTSENETRTPRRPQDSQSVVINLKGELDSKLVSIKAEDGDRRRRGGAVTVRGG